MTAQLGAHEVMEVHEVLCNSINAIHQTMLYRPHIKSQQLASIVDKQMQFMNQEYNGLVQAIHQQGMNPGSSYPTGYNYSPTYGLRNPDTHSPQMSANQLTDSDIASGILGIHKSGAIFKTMAALECADPNLRRMIQQGANNCSEQAYEIWQYMNQEGYYQVPTMKQMTTNTVMDTYAPSNIGNMGNMNQLGMMGNMSTMASMTTMKMDDLNKVYGMQI